MKADLIIHHPSRWLRVALGASRQRGGRTASGAVKPAIREWLSRYRVGCRMKSRLAYFIARYGLWFADLGLTREGLLSARGLRDSTIIFTALEATPDRHCPPQNTPPDSPGLNVSSNSNYLLARNKSKMPNAGRNSCL